MPACVIIGPTTKEAEMQHKLLLMAVLLATGFVALRAQQTSDNPPLYHGVQTHVDGVFVTPVAGVPFSATVLIRSEQTMPDGTTVTKTTINLIGRDSRGRIHNERRSLVPESFRGTPNLTEVHIFDLQTRMNTFYDPITRIARQRVLPEPLRAPNLRNSSNPLVKVEDLDATNLEGFMAKGLRRSTTIPAQASGTGAAVTVVDEYWYSEDLHMNLLVRHTDPRSGIQTVALSNINREEPPPAFFEVPEGYKIVDMTPPPGAPAAFGGAVAGSPIPQ
jgi:hypothetical protein